MANIFDTLENKQTKSNIFDKVTPIYETKKTQNVVDKVTNYVFPSWLTEAKFEKDKYNVYGDIGERVPGFIRAGLQGKNPVQGFKQPSTIPSTGEYLYLKQDDNENNVLEAAPAAVVGTAMDMAMNPFTYVGGILGKSKSVASGVKQATVKATELGSNVSSFVKPVSNIVSKGIKNTQLTFGTPMRNFRKFMSKQEYSADDLKNLPLKDQITAQAQKAKATTTLQGQEISGEIGKTTEEIGRIKESKLGFQQFGQAVKGDIVTKKKILGQQKQSDFTLQKINDRNARNIINDNISMLDEELTKVTQQGAEDIQPLLKDFFKSNSKAYGERLDKYSEVLANSDNPLLLDKAYQILDDTASGLDSMQITSGRGRALIEKLKVKYNPYNAEGELVRPLNEVIDFKEYNKDIRDVLKNISGSVKGGVRITQDDLAQVILHEKYGDYIAENVPAFQELQQAYRPVINGMKESGKVFKPYASEFQNTSGASFLKKSALGEATPQSEKTLGFIEQGSEFAPGVGNVSSKSKEVGSKLLTQKNALEKIKLLQREKLDKMTGEFTQKFNLLDDSEAEVNKMIIERSYELQSKIDELEKGKQSMDKLLELNKTNGELRQLQLAERKLRINKLSNIKHKANIIKLAIAGGASLPTGIPQKVAGFALRSVLGDISSGK
jgi:hypothetical protein